MVFTVNENTIQSLMYRVSQKNATSYISLDFKGNRKPVFIIFTLLEGYISQLSTMKKSQ